jgi:SLA1 homology domain 1, SHD1
VEAEFKGLYDGKILLHKLNGVTIGVPSEKMSPEDMKYIARITGKDTGVRTDSIHRDTSASSMPKEVFGENVTPSVGHQALRTWLRPNILRRKIARE